MKLTTKQIEEVKFTVQEKGYSAKEVDEFLDKVVSDYESLNNAQIVISASYNGDLLPNSVAFDGTVADWIHIENKGIFENVPCINCSDGQYVQKL